MFDRGLDEQPAALARHEHSGGDPVATAAEVDESEQMLQRLAGAAAADELGQRVTGRGLGQECSLILGEDAPRRAQLGHDIHGASMTGRPGRRPEWNRFSHKTRTCSSIGGERRRHRGGTMTEAVLDRLGIGAAAVPLDPAPGAPLRSLLPDLHGQVTVVDLGVESAALDEGRWLASDAEARTARAALDEGAAAVVVPYGVFRLSRAAIDSATAAPTWPVETEIHLSAGERMPVASPHEGRAEPIPNGIRLAVDDQWAIEIRGVEARSEPGEGHAIRPGEEIAWLPASSLLPGIRSSAKW